MSQCKIILENYEGTYYPGNNIRGRLECYFDDNTTVRGIKIRLKCKEYNEWTTTETYTDPIDNKSKTRHITLTGDHNVLFMEQMLFGSDHGSTTINRGRHVYPFSYTLPSDIPSTFKGPHGSISYKLKGIVDRPMRTDYEDVFIFAVVAPIDFNISFKEHQEVVTYSDEKTVCCWCCKGGDITMDVELPKTAFVAGEIVPFKVSISNLSNSNVDDLKVKFIKTITYKVTSPKCESKEDVDKILSFSEHGVGAHGEHTYDLKLEIPKHTDVPNFTRCNLFDVSYELQLSCEMPLCTLDLDISIWNIKMGHIQYYEGANNHQHQEQTVNKVTPGFAGFPSGENAYPPPPGGYPPFPPPPAGAYPPVAPYPPVASYPPFPGASYLPSPGSYPSAYPPGGSEKVVYPPGAPTAPTSIANAPPIDDNPKAREAAGGFPSAPFAPPEQPPPSYNQVQQDSASYPPQ